MCLGIPARIVARDEGPLATVDAAGVEREIDMTLLPDAKVGDWVVVHMGFALDLIEPDDARSAMRALDVETS